MPNYCECWLVIESDNDGAVAAILASVKSSDGKSLFDFDRIIPYPAEWRKMDEAAVEWRNKSAAYVGKPFAQVLSEIGPRPEDAYNHGGYEWCLENWGTKWNAIKPKIVENRQWRTIIKFKTAWAPPLPVIDKLAEMFPTIDFMLEYYERGMEFCGSTFWNNGRRAKETQGKYYGFRGG